MWMPTCGRARTFTHEADEHLVDVTFTIREGRQFRIGQVDVTGNETTKDKSIRDILDEYGFTPGQLYNAKIAPKEGSGLLEKYIQRGVVTDQAMIRPVNPAAGSDPNSRDARVDIKEGMTGLVRPGVGFSSDSGVIGQLIYEQRNFDISDTPENWEEVLFPWKAWRGGGQQFSVRLEPGAPQRYSVNFTDPYWNDQPITFDALGRSWKWFRESYDENRLKGAFEFEQRMADYWRRSKRVSRRSTSMSATWISMRRRRSATWKAAVICSVSNSASARRPWTISMIPPRAGGPIRPMSR